MYPPPSPNPTNSACRKRFQNHTGEDWMQPQQSAGERHWDPKPTSSHHSREKRIVESLIENTWKAQYQKDLLQSLKQNASIKYIIDCCFFFPPQVWNRHDEFIKCSNKIILLMAGEDVQRGATSDFSNTLHLQFSWTLVEYCHVFFPSSERLDLSNHFFFFLFSFTRFWGCGPSDTPELFYCDAFRDRIKSDDERFLFPSFPSSACDVLVLINLLLCTFNRSLMWMQKKSYTGRFKMRVLMMVNKVVIPVSTSPSFFSSCCIECEPC